MDRKLVDYKADGQTYEWASYSVSDRIEGPTYLAVDQQTDRELVGQVDRQKDRQTDVWWTQGLARFKEKVKIFTGVPAIRWAIDGTTDRQTESQLERRIDRQMYDGHKDRRSTRRADD